MDFSAFNPISSNSLNMAARNNDIPVLKRLLRKNNPNCVDNRGWTCLHEAAANDNLECVQMILKHSDCRPLAETFEGHTALYLACRNKCSMKCITLLLESVEDIAQYASTEMVSPLHLACQQGNIELAELLIQYDSIIDLQDFDGDTPLHDAVCNVQPDVVALLLHSGAQAEKRNQKGFTPFHLACGRGSMECVLNLYPFVTDINQYTENRWTPLMLASQQSNLSVVEFLLTHGADPNVSDSENHIALTIALTQGHSDVFRSLLNATDRNHIPRDIFIQTCKPHVFNIDIMTTLLESDLGPEFFNECDSFYAHVDFEDFDYEPVYTVNPPLNNFLRVADYIYKLSPELFRKLFYLLLMRGVSVNALNSEECPPLTYIHYCDFSNCIEEVITILISQGVNIDYGFWIREDNTCTIPDIIQTSLSTGCQTLATLLTYSFVVEPEELILFMKRVDSTYSFMYSCMKDKIYALMEQKRGLAHLQPEKVTSPCVPTLEHLGRRAVRKFIRESGLRTTVQFLKAVHNLPLPVQLIEFIRYII